jgi:hypothetical protein
VQQLLRRLGEQGRVIGGNGGGAPQGLERHAVMVRGASVASKRSDGMARSRAAEVATVICHRGSAVGSFRA